MHREVPSLLWRVFDCHACPSRYGFTPGAEGRYLKFPPTIGATGKADLLFVGINPRLTGNAPWLERMMRDREEFQALAENRKDGQPYIRAGGIEAHYEIHVRIVRDVFGAGAKFEDHAAVTELFFCATTDTSGDFPQDGSDCADEYFGDVVAQVQPKAVVCLGGRVLRYVRAQSESDGALVVAVPHPGNGGISDAGREAAIREAISEIRVAVLRG